MKNKTLSILIATGFFLINSREVIASYLYETTEPSSQIIIDKKVRSVLHDSWSDNLSKDNILFTADDLIEFKITIKNTGDQDLTNVKVVDYIPNYISRIFNPGDYSNDNRSIKWTYEKLTPGEEKEEIIRVKVDNADKLPNSQQFCLVNKADVFTNEGPSDTDTSEFCIETRILAEKELPQAGSNLLLTTILASALAGAGIIARKFGRGEI